MPQPCVLLVDDDYQLVRGLRASLLNEGYDAITATDGLEGLKAARHHRPDLVVLDINMPWLDGLEVCHRLRGDETLSGVPILFLTARDTVEERVAGLDEGADDYLTKPFATNELKARIRALLRRAPGRDDSGNGTGDDKRLQVGPLTLDTQAFWVQVDDGEQTHLTPAEFELLHFLMTHPGRAFSSDELLEEVWAYEPGMADRSLARWHIRNLRAKIEPDPGNPVYIRTVPRHGYILEAKGE